MIIGIEASSLSSKQTGTSRYLNCLLEQLNQTDNKVEMFNAQDQFKRNNIRDKFRKNWQRNFSLAHDIKKSYVDCMIFPDYYMPFGVKKKSAIIIHDLSFITHPQFYSKSFAAYYNFQILKTLKQNPVVVTVSEHTKKNVGKYLGVKEEEILIVQGYSSLISKTNFDSGRKQGEQPYLLYVGHIEPRKNLSFLVEGFIEWKEKTKSNLRLKLAGELWIKSSALNILINKFKDHPDIDFYGYISEEELRSLYVDASGFVHTSFEEGFGFPVLEAMHFGLPVLCSEGIATEEISKPCSVTINPFDMTSYLEGLDRLNELICSDRKINYEIKYSAERTRQQLDVLLERLNHKSIYAAGLPKAKNYEEALEKTLIYSSLFNCGIAEEKIHPQVFDVMMTEKDLHQTIRKLILDGKAEWKEDSLFLKARANGFYKRSNKTINKKKAKKILDFLNTLPLVSMIAFSGGTSNYGIASHDDVDLFIITKPHSVYLVYLMIHIYSILSGARKQLCANYLIDETNMKINYSYDFYTAHQIITLTPFKNPEMLNNFWNGNEWVKKFFPNFYFSFSARQNRKHQIRFSCLRPFNFLIKVFYRILYSKKLSLAGKNKSLVIESDCLKLHTNDHRQRITEEFEDALIKFYADRNITIDAAAEQKALVI